MEKDIKGLLDEEIERTITNLSAAKAGSTDYADILDDLTKLHSLRIGELKYLELQDKKEASDREALTLEMQAKEQKTERYLKYAIEGCGIVLPLGFYWIWMRRGFKFEEVGTYTSQTFKSLYGKFKIK